MADPTTGECGGDLLRRLGTDAEKWCAEMVKRGVVVADPAPGGWLHGWMCNAIETARSAGYSEAERRIRDDLALFDKRASWADKLKSLRALKARAWFRRIDHGPA